MPSNLTDFAIVISFILLIFVDCHSLEINPPQQSSVVLESHNPSVAVGDVEKHIGNKNILDSAVSNDQVIAQNTSVPLKKSLETEIHKHRSPDISQIPLEGGGIGATFLTPNNSTLGMEPVDQIHDKVSKGRKGVQFPGSSVVARKGAPLTEAQLEAVQPNNTLPLETSHLKVKNSTINNRTEHYNSDKISLVLPPSKSTNESQNVLLDTNVVTSKESSNHTPKTPHLSHAKKPEYVSDKGDIDDSDKYSLIHTSTTGEDYVIIGIVIVIGIWFSVFGALIFYRRAGEYWDRRHYRRMDFLVEGMYND